MITSMVGSGAEAIVYAYAACDRTRGLARIDSSPEQRDRFTGVVWTPDESMVRSLAALTAANELDVMRHAELTLSQRNAIRAWLARCRPFLDPIAQRSVDAAQEAGGADGPICGESDRGTRDRA